MVAAIPSFRVARISASACIFDVPYGPIGRWGCDGVTGVDWGTP
jgi:hypothetical protein